MDKKQLAETILNSAVVREVLRSEIPQIAEIESLDKLEKLRLVDMKIGIGCSEIELTYQAVAPSSFYPNVKEKLISQGVEDCFLSVVTRNKGKGDECESLSFKFDSEVVGRLIVYNPKYGH